jgi:RNA polymerase sigma-70 factor, ECF subfamily
VPYARESLETRFKSGDPEVVGTVSHWISLVLTAPRFRCLRRQWVDLHQEVMTRTLQALAAERVVPDRDLRVYVQAIARNVAVDALVRHLRERSEEPDNARLRVTPPMQVEAVLLDEVLSSLAEPCRSLVLDYFIGGRSYEEIGATLAIPVGTVKSRLFRCLESAGRALAPRLQRERR